MQWDLTQLWCFSLLHTFPFDLFIIDNLIMVASGSLLVCILLHFCMWQLPDVIWASNFPREHKASGVATLKSCIWHYTASWCEQCLNYCIEMLSKQKKLPRLNPQGRQSSPDQLWKDRERAATVWLQASFLRRQADIETKVNKLNALAHLLTTLICLPIAGSGIVCQAHFLHSETHSFTTTSICFFKFSSNYKSA